VSVLFQVRMDDRARTWTTPWGVSGKMDGAGGASRGDRKLDDGSLSWENTVYISGARTLGSSDTTKTPQH